MNLSPHFTLKELIRSETAKKNEIDNNPNDEVIANLTRIAYTLEIVRLVLGAPIDISSGYRCKELNTLIRGSRASKHMYGLAVDFTVRGYSVADAIELIKPVVGVDIVIDEFSRWIHLGLSDDLRNIHLLARKVNGKTEYISV